MTEHVLIERSAGVLTLTLNRPEKKNALSPAMYEALGDAIDGAGDDPDVRCVLIQANGDMFTAGNDLGDFAAANSGASTVAPRRGASALIQALGRASTPVVAAVQGRAVGVGTTMLLHCDLVFVSEDALLTTPFASLALVPEAASSILLPARIGRPPAVRRGHHQAPDARGRPPRRADERGGRALRRPAQVAGSRGSLRRLP